MTLDNIVDFNTNFNSCIAPNSLDTALLEIKNELKLQTLLVDIDTWFKNFLNVADQTAVPLKRGMSNFSAKSQQSLVCREQIDFKKVR